jgi:T-complex protein 1 subunit beta
MQDLVSNLLCISLTVSLTTIRDMEQGTIESMRKLGITESYKLKRQVILSASEAAEMIIRYALNCWQAWR